MRSWASKRVYWVRSYHLPPVREIKADAHSIVLTILHRVYLVVRWLKSWERLSWDHEKWSLFILGYSCLWQAFSSRPMHCGRHGSFQMLPWMRMRRQVMMPPYIVTLSNVVLSADAWLSESVLSPHFALPKVRCDSCGVARLHMMMMTCIMTLIAVFHDKCRSDIWMFIIFITQTCLTSAMHCRSCEPRPSGSNFMSVTNQVDRQVVNLSFTPRISRTLACAFDSLSNA